MGKTYLFLVWLFLRFGLHRPLGFLLLLVLGLLGAATFSMVSSAEELPVLARASAVIENQFGLQYRADAELGDLPIGTKGRIEIEISNPTTQPFNVNEISPSCACLTPTISKAEINPSGSTVFSFDLETPSKSHDGWVRLGAELQAADSLAIVLNIKYRLAGLLAFQKSVAVVELPSQTKSEFRIPVVLTSPILAKAVVIEKEGDFDHVQFTLDSSKSGVTYLVGTLDSASNVNSKGLVGKVTLLNEEPLVSTEVSLIIRRADAFAISPAVLQFKANDDKRFLARAIVRFQAFSDDEIETDGVIFQCKLADESLAVTPRYLGNGVYRLTVAMNDVVADKLASGFIPVSLHTLEFHVKGKFGVYSAKNGLHVQR